MISMNIAISTNSIWNFLKFRKGLAKSFQKRGYKIFLLSKNDKYKKNIPKNIKFIEIKGGISQRERNIKSFKNGDINVIFLNSRFNGSGINLQECSDIIIYHEMGKNMINQVLGRANRIGRQKPLNVHYLEI